MTNRARNLFAEQLGQIYQDIGDLHGADAQMLLREALDGLYHGDILTAMSDTIDETDASHSQTVKQEWSKMLSDFVVSGRDAEVILNTIAPLCAQDNIRSVSQVVGLYIEQQKRLLYEVSDPTEQEKFQQRYSTLLERSNRYFGGELRLAAERHLRKGSLAHERGQA